MSNRRRAWRRQGYDRKPHQWNASTGECGKFAFTSRKAAKAHARKLNDPGLREYRCGACSLWHFGHLAASIKAGHITAPEIYRPSDADGPPAA